MSRALDIAADALPLPDRGDDPDQTRLHTTSVPGSPLDPVPTHGEQLRRLVHPELPPVLVLGGAGGAGVTTTVLGLTAAAATHDPDAWPIAVDATAYGTDLAYRGCDTRQPVSTVQMWLDTTNPELPAAIDACTGHTSTGVRIMPRTADPLPRRETFVSVHQHLLAAGMLPIYDGGGAVTNRHTRPLLADPRIGLVLVAAARPDAINRLTGPMTWLDSELGEYIVSRTVLVVVNQLPVPYPAAAGHVRSHLAPYVRAVVEIPYDPHLAEGRPVSWQQLSPATRAAYQQLRGALQ